MNYYNEFDPKAAAWLRELIRAGAIPAGDVDTRSICDVRPEDLRGYTQCHFFAGIGGWSYALQLAGWPSDRPVWTGSCPCQPYSTAGKQLGEKDERNLWPVFFNLIRECRPERAFGEQVANAIGHGWLDGISADLEKEGYTCGACVLGAHSVSAPHIRQRLYWVAHPGKPASERNARGLLEAEDGVSGSRQLDGDNTQRLEHGGTTHRLAFSASERGNRGSTATWQEGRSGLEDGGGLVNSDISQDDTAKQGQRLSGKGRNPAGRNGSGSEQTDSGRLGQSFQSRLEGLSGHGDNGNESRRIGADEAGSVAEAGTVGGMGNAESSGQRPRESRCDSQGGIVLAGTEPRGDSFNDGTTHWHNFTLIPCRDGKVRRVPQSLVCSLADGLSTSVDDLRIACHAHPLITEKVEGRVGLLKGYGNAIVPQVAAEFIQACTEEMNPESV